MNLTVRGTITEDLLLTWPSVPIDALRSWQHKERTTEHGACAVAVLLADLEFDCRVIRTSVRRTEFDYWMGHADSLLSQDNGKLEVSGIR